MAVPTKTLVITGASAGIGRATAREFARNGFSVALIARGKVGLEAAAREVEAFGGRAIWISADVSDPAAIEAASDQVADEFGHIDVWVNNAFAGIFSPFLEVQPDEFTRVTEVTYLGQVNGTRAALRHMLPRNRGSIVLVGSALAHRGIPLQSAYCGAKHAIQGFQDSLRAELLSMGSKVRLTMVQPSGVNTPQFDWIRARVPGNPRPVGTIYQPEIVANAIWTAAHSRRKQWIVGRPAYQAILAEKLLSPVLDRYLASTGVRAQYAPEPLAADRQDNLFKPVDEDRGAHGRFDADAVDHAPSLKLSRQRSWLAAGASALLAAGIISQLSRRRS